MTRERRNSRSPRGFPPGKKVFFTDEICQTTKTLLSSGSSRVHKSICREHKGTRSWTWIVWFSSIGYGLIIHRIRNSYVTMDFVITTSPFCTGNDQPVAVAAILLPFSIQSHPPLPPPATVAGSISERTN